MSSTKKFDNPRWNWSRSTVARWAIVIAFPFIVVGIGVLVAYDLRPETTSFWAFPIVFIGCHVFNTIVEQSNSGRLSSAKWDQDEQAKRVQSESYATSYWIGFWALCLIVVATVALYVRDLVTLQEVVDGGVATGALTLMLLPSVVYCAKLALRRDVS